MTSSTAPVPTTKIWFDSTTMEPEHGFHSLDINAQIAQLELLMQSDNYKNSSVDAQDNTEILMINTITRRNNKRDLAELRTATQTPLTRSMAEPPSLPSGLKEELKTYRSQLPDFQGNTDAPTATTNWVNRAHRFATTATECYWPDYRILRVLTSTFQPAVQHWWDQLRPQPTTPY